MPSARFPLAGSLTNRNLNAVLSDTKDQRFTNCFPEVVKNPLSGKQDVWLNKRQGYIASSDVAASATGSYGSVVWTANSAATAPAIFSFLKSTGTSMMFFDSAGTQIGGDVASTNKCLSMEETDISGTGNLTAILTDSGTTANEAWFFPEGGSWTQITDADFPSNITPAHCHLDGYMFVMDVNAKLYNSDVNSLSSWAATSFITANSFADNGVGCARYRDLVVGFGDLSMEFFRNAGNPTGSPLVRLENQTRRIGAVRNSQDGVAIRAIGDTVYWLGVDAGTGAKGIYRLNGLEPEKISTTNEDKLLGNGAVRSIMGAFTLLGMSHIAFGTQAEGTILCYCVNTGAWWYFFPGSSGFPAPSQFLAVNTAFIAKSYMAASTHAKIYTFNPNSPVWQDDGSAYTMTVQTDNLSMDSSKRKFYHRLAVDCELQSATSNLGVSWSDDDYANFSTVRNIDMSQVQTWINSLGSAYRRAWKFTHSANTSCRILAVEIDYALADWEGK